MPVTRTNSQLQQLMQHTQEMKNQKGMKTELKATKKPKKMSTELIEVKTRQEESKK